MILSHLWKLIAHFYGLKFKFQFFRSNLELSIISVCVYVFDRRLESHDQVDKKHTFLLTMYSHFCVCVCVCLLFVLFVYSNRFIFPRSKLKHLEWKRILLSNKKLAHLCALPVPGQTGSVKNIFFVCVSLLFWVVIWLNLKNLCF